jgi:hypothetical protein
MTDIMEIHRDRPIQLIVVPAGIEALDGPFGREKLAPVLSLFSVEGVENGLVVCQRRRAASASATA